MVHSYYTMKPPHSVLNKGSFWWKDIVSLADVFRGIAQSTVRAGTSVLFWGDLFNGELRCNRFPNLYLAALNKEESVKQIRSRPLEDAVMLPLNAQAYGEFLMSQSAFNHIHLQVRFGDHWSFIWNVVKYLAQRLYKLIFSCLQPPRPLV